jgi:hypothetical protein
MVRITLSPARARLLAVSMILSPALILFGHLITVPADSPHPQYVDGVAANWPLYYVSAVMIAGGCLLLPIWCVGVLALTPGRGGAWTAAGSVLATVAAFALGAGNFMFGAVMGGLAPTDRAVALRVAEIADTAPAFGIAWQFAYFLQFGAIALAIGMIRSRRFPLWVPIVLIVGVVLLTFSGTGGWFTFAMLLPFGVGLAAPGVLLWRGAVREASVDSSLADGLVAAAQ